MRKILLNKRRGKESVNNENIIPVKIDRDVSLYHDEIKTTTLDTMQIYNDEKDASTKHRFIFTLYPICTNTLFNKITEVVYKEGDKGVTMLLDGSGIKRNEITPTPISNTDKITRIQAIRNTEYTNDNNLSYHCGVDIFNNHLLRSKEDISIQRRTDNIVGCTVWIDDTKTAEITNNEYIHDAFNTIGDYNRNNNGVTLESKIPTSINNYTYRGLNVRNTPIYTHDNTYNIYDAYNANIERKNGWWGFTNPSTFAIPVRGTNYYVNELFNNKEACQFIDMCPERDLFYFTPKKNPYRKRLEYNWEYFLTYPFESDYENSFLSGNTKGLPIVAFDTGNTTNNGLEIVVIKSPVKHNLKKGDYVLVKNNSGFKNKCEVINIGDINGKNQDRCFRILKREIGDITPTKFSKIVNGFECEYYFRKFKKIKTIDDKDLKNNLSRLAFANTIYGDEVSQIVYTDDIDIDGLKDNRGRPLTEIFLTIVKNNKGYREWYNYNDESNTDIGSDTIEYSHIFGEVTSGLDLPSYVGIEYPSIRKQHNINNGNKYTNNNILISKSSAKLERELPYKSYSAREQIDVFYGDLVEFCPATVEETVLEDVMHRFNTAQRECTKLFTTIYHDEIKGDIYKNSVGNQITCSKINEGFANLDPEGYIYKPHYRIKINEFDKLVYQESDFLMKDVVNSSAVTKENKHVGLIITATTSNNLLPGDMIGVLDKKTKGLNQYKVISCIYDDNIKQFKINCELINKSDNFNASGDSKNYVFFVHNTSIPEYAYMLPDGSGRHLWRNIVKPSEWDFTDDLYKTPFTNGAFYHHTNITFFVRRQDPFEHYEMYLKDREGNKFENKFAIPSKEIDYSTDEYFTENKMSCY